MGEAWSDRKVQELLLGTLGMLILQTLGAGAANRQTIAHVTRHRPDNVLQIEQGSLYPALRRLENRGWVCSYRGVSKNNVKERFYRLNAAGRKQLRGEARGWQAMVKAIGRVIEKITRTAEQE